LGGYSDWYLPSKNELNQLYNNKVAIGGFANSNYWSSTENLSYYAFFQDVGDGNQYFGSKDYYYKLRAVRAF
jgi:hypothetical protein